MASLWPGSVEVAHLLLLSAATLALYGRALSGGFVLDDGAEVLQDRLIRSFSNIRAIFAHSVWYFAGVKTSNYYRPGKLLAYMVEYCLFAFHPFFWHLASVLFHLTVVVAIYFLVRDLASRELAFWTALWFAFHPVHVEAVAWIAPANDVLCGLALVLALWLYHRGRTGRLSGSAGLPPRPAVLEFGLSVLLFFAALLFKETALTFPALILAYDFFYRGESLRQIARGWRRYVAYFALLGVYLSMRIHALGGLAPDANQLRTLTAADMILSVPALASKYLWKALVPIHLNFWYVYKPVLALGWKPAGAILLCLFLVAAMFLLRRRQPLLSLALAWFWLTLIPALDIPRVSANIFTDRYLYVPSIGFCVFAAWGWLWLLGRVSRPALRRVAYAGVAAS